MAKEIKKSVVINDDFPSIIIPDERSATRRRRKESCVQKTSSAKKARKSDNIADVQESHPSATCSVSLTPSADEDMENLIGSYKMDLVQHKAVIPVDDDFFAFMLQDYNQSCRTLKDSYEIVSRKGFSSPEGPRILYMCSCNVARRRMIESLPVCASVDTDFESPYEECIHISVMKHLVDEFDVEHNISAQTLIDSRSGTTDRDDHTYDKTSPEVMVYGMEDNDQVLCVTWKEFITTTYTIVRIDFSGQKSALKCSSCKKSDCKHCKAVYTQSMNPDGLLLETLKTETKWRSRYVPVPVSKDKIPFANDRKSCIPLTVLKPNADGSCPECQSPWSLEVDEAGESVKIYTRCEILNATVFRRHCGNQDCRAIKEYDGAEDQLLNMGSYLVSHDVLRSYMRQFVTEGTTMASFYKEWYWQQIDNGNCSFSDEFSYNRFRYAWYSFLGLLDVNYREGFACPECGDEPEVVVMDGVTLGVRKCYMPWQNFLNSKASRACLDGSSHNTRVFVSNQRSRQLLTKYATKGVSMEEFRELQATLRLYQPCLLGLLQSFIDDGFVYKCPQTYSDFLRCLGSSSPVCGLIHNHPGFLDLLGNLADGVNVTCDPNSIILIEQQCPVLLQLLKDINWEIPDCLRDILKEVITKAQSPFIGRQVHDLPTCDDSCSCTGIGYFPNLQKINHRGDYVLDDLKKKKQEISDNCTKNSPSHKTLSPGLFTLSCVHGICYGFEIMEDVESPNVPFTILRTRFHTAPKIVIYDNACHLHNYALNRDPVFFQNTWFLVDRFHWCNHVGCHLGYCLDMYLQHRKLNSQVAEQRNATLKKLRSMLSYMSIDNFTSHLKIFFWFRSMISLSSLVPDLPIKNLPFCKQLAFVYSKFKNC